MPIDRRARAGPQNQTTMSKGNMLLGHARGKVGDLVFSRVNGQQVTRARAAVVKNPQTEAQMIQRILLNTVVQAYSRMSEICDHSFEGVPNGQKSMNAFMRKNLSALRQYLAAAVADGHQFDDIYAFCPVGVNMFCMNEYVVSTGSLPQVDLESISAANGAKIAIVAAGTIPTYGEIIDQLGLQRGDQLTFIGQEAYTDSRAAFKFARVILDPRNTDGTEATLDTAFLDGENNVNLPSPRNEGETISFSFAAGKLGFTFGNGMFGACVIVSRQRGDGSWLRSNAQIVLDGALPHGLVGSYSMGDALNMLYAGALDMQSERYLNNAKKIAGDGSVADTLIVNTLGGASVELVGIRNIAITNTGEATSQITQAVSAYDTDGADHLIYCANTYCNAYDLILNDANGDSIQDAWKVAKGDVTAPAGAQTAAVPLWTENGQTSSQEGVQWLIRKGVNLGAFIERVP